MMTRERTLALGCLTALLTGVAGFGAYSAASREPTVLLDADHCPAQPSATAFLVFDTTEAWPEMEQERMRRAVLAIAERLPKHAQLALYTIGEDPEATATPWQGFRRCKPTDPNSLNPVTQNEAFERARYRRQFLIPLTDLLPELVAGRGARQSPILEALEVLAWSPAFARAHPLSLVLFSDLQQASPVFTHLKGPLPSPCRFLTTALGQRLQRHDWSRVRVELVYLRGNARDQARQGPQHLAWWGELFTRLGVAEVRHNEARVANPTTPCPHTTARRGAHGQPQR